MQMFYQGKASKKVIFITLGSDPPLGSKKKIWGILDHFLALSEKNVFLSLEKLKTLC